MYEKIYSIQSWLEDGAIGHRAKLFQNMRHPPLINGDPESKIINLVNPMELHLLLGKINIFHIIIIISIETFNLPYRNC